MGTARTMREGTDVAVLTLGPIGNTAARAIDEIEKTYPGKVAQYDMRFLKPLDESMLKTVGENFKYIITIEDGVRKGGMGSAVLEWMNDHGYTPTIVRMGLPDNFVEHGTVPQLMHIVGLDKEAIVKEITKGLTH